MHFFWEISLNEYTDADTRVSSESGVMIWLVIFCFLKRSLDGSQDLYIALDIEHALRSPE